MLILLKILSSSRFWGIILLVTSAFVLMGFFNTGTDEKSQSERALEKIKQLVKEETPSAYSHMEHLAKTYKAEDINTAYELYKSRYGLSATQKWAQELESNNAQINHIVHLARVSNEGQGLLSPAAQDNLALMAALSEKKHENEQEGIYIKAFVEQYINEQNAARNEGGKTWETVCAQPFSLIVYRTLCLIESTANRAQWDSYCERASWLADAVMLLSLYDLSEQTSQGAQNLTKEQVIKQFVALCIKYPSLSTYAQDLMRQWNNSMGKVNGHEDAHEIAIHLPILFSMYNEYGKTIELIHKNTNAPVAQCVDVILSNSKLCQQDEKQFVKEVCEIFQLDKDVWGIIGMESNALLLYRHHKIHAIDVLKEFAADNVSELIVMAATDMNDINGQAVHQAIEATHRYKEIALHVINEHGEDYRFASVLAKDFRVIPYIAKHGVEGIKALTEDNWKGTLDKELEPNGEPKEKSWVQYVPGGAIYTIIKNKSQGYPCSWEEMGWAAFEVGEAALLVASAGTSSIATTAAKSAAKSTALAASKSAARKAVTQGLRGSSRKIAQANVKKALTVQGRSRFLSGKAWASAKNITARSLSRLTTVGRYSFKTTKAVASGGWRAMSKLPPNYYRSAAYGLICIEIACRTLPNLDKVIAGLTKTILTAIKDVFAGVIKGFTQAAQEATESFWNSLGSKILYGIFGVLAFLGGVFLIRKQNKKPKLSKRAI